ncbi:hypothetical protein [Pantoea agglomerans]|uniref:hypothetical protein n=1 Tax=Enterobacter agglomerans TaxID=549 RepID=UPI001CCF9C98|nr:hypothetical protein [Pantoea agglomerans]UBN55273.1 hypothetical protein LB453_06855 [Pantoea agglomerans]
MTERGMIFNAEMVRAVLDGRKTQTRRALKLFQNAVSFTPEWDIDCQEIFVAMGKKDHTEMNPVLGAIRCPFGAVGDRLWVRETWQAIHDSLDEFGNVDERTWIPSIPKSSDSYWHAVYAEEFGVSNRVDRGFPWRPAIHMPRWASRITLEITGVRVERLNDISENDARAEGVQPLRGGYWRHYQPEWTQHQLSARGSFATLWKSIYGEESWQASPWVWVIEFKRVEDE